jgi:hypothetical protein
LTSYLNIYRINNNNTYNFYLSKPNIKLLCLFILSTIKLNNSNTNTNATAYKQHLYKILLDNTNIDISELQIKIMYRVLRNLIGSNNMLPILYDRKVINMKNFVASNYINILCGYNNNENNLDIYFNVKKIVNDIFDDNCNILEIFKNKYILENVFTEGSDVINYVNNVQYPEHRNSRNSRNSSYSSYSSNSNSRS